MPFTNPAPRKGDSEQVLLRKTLQAIRAKAASTGGSDPKNLDLEEPLLVKLLGTLQGQPAGAGGISSNPPRLDDEENTLIRKLLGAIGEQAGGGSPPVVPTDLLHILVTGQSNAIMSVPVVAGGVTIFTQGAADFGYMFNGGLKPGSSAPNLASLIPLEETTDTVAGEIGVVSMVRWLATFAPANLRYLVSNVGVNGANYALLKKGTTPYDDSLAHIEAGKLLAAGLGLNYRVVAVVAIHGESDETLSNTSYRANLAEWQSDYETDIQAISLQAEAIPMIHAQQGAYGPLQFNSGNLDASASIQLVQAHLDAPSKVVIALPEYILDYPEVPHFSPVSHAVLGEYMGKAIKKTCLDGLTFSTIRMISAVVSSDEIVVNFGVPVSPLVADFRFSTYADGFGFQFISSDGVELPTSAEITGPTQITLTFAAPLTGTDRKLGYALEDKLPKTGRSANVRDSDTTAGLLGIALNNYMPSQYIPTT